MCLGAFAGAQEPFRFAGAACAAPPVLHCPDKDCPSDRVINQGPVVEMKTRRTYFLDYPCDLKPGETVTFILSLHGAGSYGNWQRHYFPIMDYKDKHRLVIATPNSPTRAWSAADDEYLQNIVEFVVSQIGEQNIKAFWLAGHSQGGMTSNRIVRTDFFKTGGWLVEPVGRTSWRQCRPCGDPSAPPARRCTGCGSAPARTARPAGLAPAPTELPTAISHSSTRPASARSTTRACRPHRRGPRSSAAARGARRKRSSTPRPGMIYDRSRQNPPNPAWGLLPAPGKAHVMVYDGCKDGRVVADVVRLDKGHTEGLEPNVTEELVRLMLSAKGGKLQQGQQGR